MGRRGKLALLGAVLLLGISTATPAPTEQFVELAGESPFHDATEAANIPPPPPTPPELPAEIKEPAAAGLSNSTLRTIVTDSSSVESSSGPPLVVGNSVFVDVNHSLSSDEAETLIESWGGETFGSVEGITAALVPIASLEDLEASPGIDFLSPTILDSPSAEDPSSSELPTQSVSDLLSKTRAGTWHAAGLSGQGVKIGIIDTFNQADWAAAQNAGRLPAPAGGLSCSSTGCTESLPWGGGDHGVSSAEIIHAMAPSAQLYLVGGATGSSVRERETIDWLANRGVRVINRSQGQWIYSTPGDGTGWAHNNVEYAASKGIVWINSAGNQAGNQATNRRGGHQRIPWASNNNTTHLLAPGGSTYHPVYCSGDLGLSVRWNDWNDAPANRTDFDLYLYDGSNDSATLLASSESYQQSGSAPIEGIRYSCNTGQWLHFRVRIFAAGSGSGDDTVEIQAQKGLLESWSNQYSAAVEHVDSPSAAMIGAGAIDPLEGTSIADYSSWGPTTDGRMKPDLSAASCILTLAGQRNGHACANGTSASAPVIAGAAALVISAGEAAPSGVKSYLKQHAVDRGTAGPDNVFGAGEVILPTPTANDTSPPKWPDKTLTADAQERQVKLGWTAANDNIAVAGYVVVAGSGNPVNGVYYGNEVARVGPGVRSYTVTGLKPATKYVFWVEAFDAANNASTTGPLKVRSTAAAFVDTGGNVFLDDIRWLSSVQVTLGCNPPENNRFCPDDYVTRGQMASFLVRALGLPGGNIPDFFVDDETSVHEDDINTLAYWEITLGCNPPFNDWYCPGFPVLRGQMASFLSRALLLKDGWDIDYFTDDDQSVHVFDINRLAHSGITKGCNPPTNLLYCPEGVVTRGQMAAFLHRAADHINAVRDMLELAPLRVDSGETSTQPDAPRTIGPLP